MVAFINWFMASHILIVVTTLLLLLLLSEKLKIPGSHQFKLRFNYFLLVFVLIIPLFANFLRPEFKPDPIVHVQYQTDSLKKAPLSEAKTEIALPHSKAAIPFDLVTHMLEFFVLLSLAFGAFKFWRDRNFLKDMLHASHRFKTLGRVKIVLSESARVPFSYHALTTAWVVLPLDLILEPAHLRISISHELQHHRQRDTLWLHLFMAIKYLFSLNPFLGMWLNIIHETQELACDENLIDQRKVAPREYANCLLAVAENAVNDKGLPASAAGMARCHQPSKLIRRIRTMLEQRNKNYWPQTLLALCTSVAIAAAAATSNQLLQDKRLTLSEAQELAEHANVDAQIKVDMNGAVLKELNKYLGTSSGRRFVKESLARLQAQRPMLEDQIKERGAPMELLAVPFIESGFQNLPPKANPLRAAGMWQFIARSAVNFGLTVNDSKDERMDPTLETDAGLRYLKANKLRFQNWRLALMAYNMGEKSLQNAIDKLGTCDPWRIVEAGYEFDTNYLAKVMAGIIILKNADRLTE